MKLLDDSKKQRALQIAKSLGDKFHPIQAKEFIQKHKNSRMFNKIKDKGLSKATQVAINNYVKEFGEVVQLELDSQQKSMEMEIVLNGEVEPLKLKVGEYALIKEKDSYFLKVNKIQASREWINTLSTKYLNGKKFPIAKQYAQIIEKII